jgi:hypothetical protein
MLLTKKQMMTSSDSKNKQYCVNFAQKKKIYEQEIHSSQLASGHNYNKIYQEALK